MLMIKAEVIYLFIFVFIVSLKNRPRIPTPDVSKEVVVHDLKLSSGIVPPSSSTITTTTSTTTPFGYPGEMPMVHVVLSPIQEAEGTGTLAASGHQPGAAALAQAVLSPALTSAGLGQVTLGPSVTLATVLLSFF